jgi:hypothetical protein
MELFSLLTLFFLIGQDPYELQWIQKQAKIFLIIILVSLFIGIIFGPFNLVNEEESEEEYPLKLDDINARAQLS